MKYFGVLTLFLKLDFRYKVLIGLNQKWVVISVLPGYNLKTFYSRSKVITKARLQWFFKGSEYKFETGFPVQLPEKKPLLILNSWSYATINQVKKTFPKF